MLILNTIRVYVELQLNLDEMNLKNICTDPQVQITENKYSRCSSYKGCMIHKRKTLMDYMVPHLFMTARIILFSETLFKTCDEL